MFISQRLIAGWCGFEHYTPFPISRERESIALVPSGSVSFLPMLAGFHGQFLFELASAQVLTSSIHSILSSPCRSQTLLRPFVGLVVSLWLLSVRMRVMRT